jgi:hypothetical protein
VFHTVFYECGAGQRSTKIIGQLAPVRKTERERERERERKRDRERETERDCD